LAALDREDDEGTMISISQGSVCACNTRMDVFHVLRTPERDVTTVWDQCMEPWTTTSCIEMVGWQLYDVVPLAHSRLEYKQRESM
jgi:hypothetical protein